MCGFYYDLEQTTIVFLDTIWPSHHEGGVCFVEHRNLIFKWNLIGVENVIKLFRSASCLRALNILRMLHSVVLILGCPFYSIRRMSGEVCGVERSWKWLRMRIEYMVDRVIVERMELVESRTGCFLSLVRGLLRAIVLAVFSIVPGLFIHFVSFVNHKFIEGIK
jgi:hypothetical protein